MVGVKELMFEHCVFRLLHFGPAQSTHLWGVCVKSFEHHPKKCSLAVHKPPWQHKSKQQGDFFKSAFWTCAVVLR